MSFKTIKVNPIFLMGGEKSGKNKTRKEKPATTSLGSTNIKKKLIARIKDFQKGVKPPSGTQPSSTQHSSTQPSSTHSSTQPSRALPNNKTVQSPGLGSAFDSVRADFDDSLQFLDNLSKEKEEHKKFKKHGTLKKKQPPNQAAYMQIATELPPELDWNTITKVMPKAIPNADAMPKADAMPNNNIWKASPPPSYSNLKHSSSKPSYRTWLRNTQKIRPTGDKKIMDVTGPNAIVPNAIVAPALVAVEQALVAVGDAISSAQLPIAGQPMTEINIDTNDFFDTAALDTAPLVGTAALGPAPPKKEFIKRKKITRTLKYKLGKHANGTVSVLIKNAQTRRKVQTEHALLKQKSILEIKNFLRSKNLLKAGSEAPSDVLRHIYEQSILAGQIENKAKDTLIHNYFNEEKNK